MKPPPTSQVEVATTLIRDKILDLSFEPGAPINERDLQERFGVGRTPSREALVRLAAEGLVDILPQIGAFARTLDFTEIPQLLEAYRVADRLIGHYCDFKDPTLVKDVDEFQSKQREAINELRFNDITYWHARHRLRMAETCHNRYIYEFCERTHNQVRRLVCLQYRVEARQAGFPERQVDILSQLHKKLLDALKSGERQCLIDVLTDQMHVFEKRIANAILSHPEKSPRLDFS